jgi:hypothetical protein
VRLALLAPDIVEAILAASTDQALMLERLERPLPANWMEQRQRALRHAPPENERRWRPGLHASPESRRRRNVFRGRPPLEIVFYFLLPAVAAPGFGFASAFGTVLVDATIFFLSALGFLASRLLLF